MEPSTPPITGPIPNGSNPSPPAAAPASAPAPILGAYCFTPSYTSLEMIPPLRDFRWTSFPVNGFLNGFPVSGSITGSSAISSPNKYRLNFSEPFTSPPNEPINAPSNGPPGKNKDASIPAPAPRIISGAAFPTSVFTSFHLDLDSRFFARASGSFSLSSPNRNLDIPSNPRLNVPIIPPYSL